MHLLCLTAASAVGAPRDSSAVAFRPCDSDAQAAEGTGAAPFTRKGHSRRVAQDLRGGLQHARSTCRAASRRPSTREHRSNAVRRPALRRGRQRDATEQPGALNRTADRSARISACGSVVVASRSLYALGTRCTEGALRLIMSYRFEYTGPLGMKIEGISHDGPDV
jgi:hypothetical protein